MTSQLQFVAYEFTLPTLFCPVQVRVLVEAGTHLGVGEAPVLGYIGIILGEELMFRVVESAGTTTLVAEFDSGPLASLASSDARALLVRAQHDRDPVERPAVYVQGSRGELADDRSDRRPAEVSAVAQLEQQPIRSLACLRA